jgi:hypothetical protein
MIQKVLIVVGTAFLLLLLICAGVLFWAQRAGSARQEKFFAAVTSGDAAQVLALCDPALRADIDEPILAAWMAEVQTRLGRFQGLSATDFNTSAKVTTDGSFTESKGTVNFEHGTAQSELMFRDDLLVRFSIESEQIPDGWFQGLKDTTLYQQRGEEFITRCLNGNLTGASSMMHTKLQEVVPPDKLKTMIDNVVHKAGPLQTVTFEDQQFSTTGGQTLDVRYQLKCEKADLVGNVEFRFIGLKGHLIAFNMKAKAE